MIKFLIYLINKNLEKKENNRKKQIIFGNCIKAKKIFWKVIMGGKYEY